MRWTHRACAAVFASALLITALATTNPAGAATVPNDTPATATVVTTVPTTITENTVGATTDSVDAALNCGAPATNASVWFKVTAATSGAIVVDGSASDYSVGFFVTEGTPGSGGNELVCAPGGGIFDVTAGQVYYVAAFADTVGVLGGNLSVTFKQAPPAPVISTQLNPRGVAFKDGSAQVSGTYTCSSGNVIDLYGTLIQTVGRQKINGFFEYFTRVPICDGKPHPWTTYVTSSDGLFSGGKAATVTISLACDLYQCGDGYVEQTIQLARGLKSTK